MTNGFIFIHRKLKEHWIWKSDNRLKWWLDVLLTVNYSDNKVLIGNNLIECNRGQSIKSLESWAKEWNVSKKTVSDFFKLLQKDNMLFIENLKITTRITVCNYDSYQTMVNGQETDSKRIVNGQETDSKQERYTNNKEKKDNKEKKVNESKEHLFENSKYFNNFDLLVSEIGENYQKYNLQHYYENMLNYSQSKGKKYINWLATCRTWINKDVENNKAALKNNFNSLPKEQKPVWWVPTAGTAEYAEYEKNRLKIKQ